MSATPKCPKCGAEIVHDRFCFEMRATAPNRCSCGAPDKHICAPAPAPILDFEKARLETPRLGEFGYVPTRLRETLETQAAEAVAAAEVRGRQQEKARIVKALREEAEKLYNCPARGGRFDENGRRIRLGAADFVEGL